MLQVCDSSTSVIVREPFRASRRDTFASCAHGGLHPRMVPEKRCVAEQTFSARYLATESCPGAVSRLDALLASSPAVVRMMLDGKLILILESDYIVAHAMQRVLEKEGATVHVGPCVGPMVFDAVIMDWGWARRPLAKTLSEAPIPMLAYTSDPAAILRRFPGCRVLSKPASDEGLIRAVVDLLHAPE